MNKKRLLHMGLALLGLIPTAAEAQSLVAGQGVADRARPDYDPVGSRVGAFTLYPTVTTTAAATNNYLATDTDQRGDAYLYVQPDLLVRSDLARQQFEGHIFVNQSVHASLSGDDSTQYGASANDSFDVSHDTQFRVNGSAGRFVESRASLGTFQDAAEPVKFEVYHAGIGASHSFTDLTIGGDFSGEYRNYNNTKLFDGTPVDQSYRDVRELTASGSAQYALRNGIGLIVSGQYNDEHYSFGPGSAGFIPNNSINRDSTGFNIDAGVTLELTHLILGHVEVGYLSRSYNDPQLSNFGGLSYSVDVLWNVTPITSLRFRASRSIQDTSSPQLAGYTRSDFNFNVDHELYRYVILSGSASYGSFRPNGIGVGGNEYSVGTGVRYLINRRYSLTANVNYAGRSSDAEILRYNSVAGSIGFRVAL